MIGQKKMLNVTAHVQDQSFFACLFLYKHAENEHSPLRWNILHYHVHDQYDDEKHSCT